MGGEGSGAGTPSSIWHEPPPAVRGDLTELLRPGIDRIRHMAAAGTLPLQQLLGLQLIGVEVGTVRCRLPLTPWLGWLPSGDIHSAVVGLAVDAAAGLAVVSTLPAGSASTTAQLSLGYARRPEPGSTAIDVGASVVGGWDDWIMVEAHADDAGGRFAWATSHCLRTARLRAVPTAGAARPRPPVPDGTASAPYLRPLPPGLAGWPEDAAADPPLADLFGISASGAGGGTGAAVLRMPATRWIARDGWTVFGGALVLLAELSATAAAEGPDARLPCVLESRTSFIRPARPDGRQLSATASLTRRGRRSALAGVEVRDASDTLLALASASLALY